MTGPAASAVAHWIAAPVLLPLLAAVLMLAVGERRRTLAALNVTACALGLLLAAALLAQARHGGAGAVGVYLPGNWDAPFGIVLAVDRLSALMLLVTATIAMAAALFSLARWHRAGVYFHPLFQVQLMGLNGVFLTADLFNLFVFFEVMLAASYGLLLHGSGRLRVQAGLHYLAVNLAASSLFLIGVALLYGVTGTLNFADLALRIAQVPAHDRGLLHAGAAVLAVAFLTKAAVWPLGFWLVRAYMAASAPAAAVFAVMTKVGVYAVLRLSSLLFSGSAGASAGFGVHVLLYGGLATLVFGMVGMMAAQRLDRLAGFGVLVSSGTLLAAIGFDQAELTGAALFYLAVSTLGLAALFLLIELIERSRVTDAAPRDAEALSLEFPIDALERRRIERGTDDEGLIGRAVPAALAFLGLAFLGCAIVIAGLPPLAGFLGKFAMLSALLNPAGLEATASPSATAWALAAVLVLSSLLSMVSLSGTGIRYFWAQPEREPPRLRFIECAPIAGLLATCTALTLLAEPALRYTQAAAQGLHRPAAYIGAVMSARPLPGPTTVSPASSNPPAPAPTAAVPGSRSPSVPVR